MSCKSHDSLQGLNDALSSLPLSAIEDERAEFNSLWRTWPMVIVLMLLFAASWALRKIRHMP